MSHYRHILLINIIVLFITLRVRTQVTSGSVPIFKQDETIPRNKAKEVLKYMNLSIDPCHDFYEYACGNWGKHHIVTKEIEWSTPATQINAHIDSDLQNLLAAQVNLEDSTSTRQAKDFYTSCLNAERNGQQQLTYFSGFTTKYEGFPAVPGSNWLIHHHNYNWQQVVAQLRRDFGINILIGMEVDINYENKIQNSIYMTEPSTLIPTELCSAADTKRVDIRDHEYVIIEKEVATYLKEWLTFDDKVAKKIAADIVTFEFELCTAMGETRNNENPYPNYSRKTLQELTYEYKNKIDFNSFVATSYDTLIYTPVFMATPKYYHHLIRLVSEFNITSIANYIMYRALSILSFPLHDQPRTRPNYCVNILKKYFPHALGEMYQRQYASSADKTEIEILYRQIKNSFEQSLRVAPWIEDGSRRVGLNKLKDIQLNFPSYEKILGNNMQIDRKKYWSNLAEFMSQVRTHELNRVREQFQPKSKEFFEAYTPGLAYKNIHKHVDIGWGLLQAPFYNKLYPNSIRYATIGQTIARELATAYDDFNWTLDRRESWDSATAVEYQNRSECFKHQIKNYLFNDTMSLFNKTVLRQLTASSCGLNVAFIGYLNWLNYLDPNNDFAILSKETLPELNFTNTQLFFISFAQMYCRYDRKFNTTSPIYSARQYHTLERYAVNGPLKNSIEFSKDFNCKPGSAMNPADKCVIY